MNRFADKVAVVTGGSGGIGFAIASRLAQEGARVIICARRQEALDAAVASIRDAGGVVEAQVVDVADVTALASMIEGVVARYGRLDALVNNAMSVGWGSIVDTDLETFQQDFRVNMDSIYVATRAALRQMIEQGGGAILNIASINGLLAIANMSAYSASKAALIHFSKSAAMEGAPHNVRVNTIAPGVIATPSTTGPLSEVPGYTEAVAGGVPMNRMGEPDEVAGAAAFLLSDDASYVTGVCLSVDGGKASELVVPPPPAQ
ncbi:SDR family oxidoreductase [Aestuariicella hydrocarbonica]|uniref:SDR family oxidoreductase n=1 Tax=Pseudomaricurvus hydrocarbonicus TaxID=1470433 RepID=A0A9E5JWW5_9GAMM|nr:SDR family oxidoreductase [Aestuariicella hydrocarbonica]NHO66056.1 SDR family oxidoreductase [Aestuariicella hydrocarbonica]